MAAPAQLTAAAFDLRVVATTSTSSGRAAGSCARRVAAPCLTVAGTDDPVGDDVLGRDLADRLGDARVAVLDGAGHLPWLDDPAATAAAIAGFLADAGRRRRAEVRQRLPSV